MPNKRSTRKKVSAKPVAPAPTGNSDQDPSHADKEVQKEMYLKEFDSNVALSLIDMKKNKRSLEMESNSNKSCDAMISAIPSEIRKLTLKQFAALGGTFEKALCSVRRTFRLGEINALKCTAADFKLKDLKNENDDVTDKENEDIVTDLATVQRTLKGKRGRKRTCRTPAITPKFDPNLSSTPENIRDAMPGETVFMSMAGSPVRTVDRQAAVGRQVVRTMQVEETLKECGVTPTRIGSILETLAARMDTK